MIGGYEFPPTLEGNLQLFARLRDNAGGHPDYDLDNPSLRIAQPCGTTYVYKSAEDFPTRRTPCSCGGPECVVVDWANYDA